MKSQECKRFVAIVACLMLVASCATTTAQPGYLKILYGADAAYDAAMTACAASYNAQSIIPPVKAKCIELGGYYVAARAEAVRAITLYNATKDASALDQVSYWTSYALGVAAKIMDAFNQKKDG